MLAHTLAKHWIILLSLFQFGFADTADPSGANLLTVLWWVGELRVYFYCTEGELNPYFVNSPHPIISTGVLLLSLSPYDSSFGIFSPHLWLVLHWVCALRRMAFCGVSEKVNGLLTPHHWLAWLIRQQSTPWFTSPPLYPCSLALQSCQMVSMQSWE